MKKEQCRTCGKWFRVDEMIDTDYRTYCQKGDPDEMVCEACYNDAYGRCSQCGEAREEADLIKTRDGWTCNLEHVEHGREGWTGEEEMLKTI